MEMFRGLLLEISSDEDAGAVETKKGGLCGIGSYETGHLNFGGGYRDDESDDVVVIDEVCQKPAKRLRIILNPSAKTVEDEGGDDDCVILDGDPDKSIVAVNVGVDNDSDELAIVGEKGEVACRDFPHSRHLCAMFPFASTAHEIHCGQCHCYVCDKLAPCSDWGTGTSSIDHCHASDKDLYWKTQRKTMKKGSMPAIPVSGSLLKTNPVPASIPPLPNSLPTQPLRKFTVRPCALQSHVGMPTVSQGGSHPRSQGMARASPCPSRIYKPQPHLTSLSASPTHNSNVPSRNKIQNVGNHGIPSSPVPAVLKKQRFIEATPSNRPSSYVSQLSRGSSLGRYPAIQPPTMSGSYDSNQQRIGNHAAHALLPNPKSSSLQRIGVGHSNYLPSQSQRLFEPRPSSFMKSGVHYQHQRTPVPYLNQNYLATIPLQNKVASQAGIGITDNMMIPPGQVLFQSNNLVPTQTVAASRSNAGNTSGNQLHSVISPQYKPRSLHTDEVSHTREPISQASVPVEASSHFQNGLDSRTDDFYDFSPNRDKLQIELDVSSVQSTSQANHPQLHSTLTDDPTGKGAADSLDLQTVVEADNSFRASEADLFAENTKGFWDFEMDDLLPENHSVPGYVELPLSPIWDRWEPL